MDGLDSVLDYAQQQSALLARESERLDALRRELASLLAVETSRAIDIDNNIAASKQQCPATSVSAESILHAVVLQTRISVRIGVCVGRERQTLALENATDVLHVKNCRINSCHSLTVVFSSSTSLLIVRVCHFAVHMRSMRSRSTCIAAYVPHITFSSNSKGCECDSLREMFDSV